RAWARLMPDAHLVNEIREVTIIGGGLFPRTALVLARLLPQARLTVIDAVPAHLAQARAFLVPVTRDRPDRVVFRVGVFDPSRNPETGSEPPAMGSVQQSWTSPDAHPFA